MDKSLYYLGRYKEKIISLLLNSDNVIKLINPQEDERFEIEDILLGGTFNVPDKEGINNEIVTLQGHIFDYLFVPDTTTEDKTFICIETFIDSIENTYFDKLSMDIHVYAAKPIVQLDGYSKPTSSEMKKLGFSGNRIDMLCDAINRELNGNKTFGIGNVKLFDRNPLSISLPNDKFYGKCLRYTVRNFIEVDDCG